MPSARKDRGWPVWTARAPVRRKTAAVLTAIATCSTFSSNPTHEEFDDSRLWVGPAFEPEGFNLRLVNLQLERQQYLVSSDPEPGPASSGLRDGPNADCCHSAGQPLHLPSRLRQRLVPLAYGLAECAELRSGQATEDALSPLTSFVVEIPGEYAPCMPVRRRRHAPVSR